MELRDRKDFYAIRDYQDLVGTGAEKEEMRRKVQSIYLAKGFIKDLPVVDGAIDAVRRMLELG